MPETSIPLMMMTPDKKVINTVKSKVKYHPGWKPYDYKLKEFWLTADQENEAHPYARYRKWLIQREKDFVQAIHNNQASNNQQEEAKNPNEVNFDEKVLQRQTYIADTDQAENLLYQDDKHQQNYANNYYPDQNQYNFEPNKYNE